ncbi:MAG: Fic family protein [Endozoicomonadaceae bacterium]|nr:Fic family protein [Endozoicomonadaceae bacterium]
MGHLQASQSDMSLQLRRANRIRTIHGSLAIEGNPLSEAQITAILDGKRVLAPEKDIREVRNAMQVYEQLQEWQPQQQSDLLSAHGLLMKALLPSAGQYRSGDVGVMGQSGVVHVAPPASRVPTLMNDLFQWLQQTELHPLVASSIFHYEFIYRTYGMQQWHGCHRAAEFIHPFADGNGRMGRFWQSLLLYQWSPVFQHLPIESMVYSHQQDYYQALNQSNEATDSAAFLSFMLDTILATLQDVLDSKPQVPPQDNPQVTPQVKALLGILKKNAQKGALSRSELMEALSLSDRKSFR